MINAKAQSYQRGKYRVPEVAKAAGPQEIGITGDGSYNALFGRNWAAVLNKRTRKAELYRETPGGWEQVDIPDLAHPTKEVRHLALAFDGSARHILAYEHAGQIHIRQWDAVAGAFVYRGPWPGVDPVLINDTEANYYQPDSDVLLLYLSPDRKSLCMRVQREQYDTERVLETFLSAKTLDLVVPLGYQWQAEGDGLNVRSDMYPVYLPHEQLASAALDAPTSGLYRPLVVVLELPTEELTAAALTPPSGGNLRPYVVVSDLGSENLTAAALTPPPAGNYRALVVVLELPTEELSIATLQQPGSGLYRLLVVTVTLPTDDLATADLLPITGGTYAQP